MPEPAEGPESPAERTQQAPDGEPAATPPSDGRRRDGRLLRRTTTGLVVLVLALAVAADAFLLGPRWLGWEGPDPATEPSRVEPPPGLTLPSTAPAPEVAAAVAPAAADPEAVRRALAPLLRDPRLGRRVAVAVADGTSSVPVFSGDVDRVTPASTLKLLTGAAALASLGQQRTFTTEVVTGQGPRQIVLVGGGDPLLAGTPPEDGTYPPRADLQTLAHATAKRLRELGRERVRLRYDAGLFTGPAISPDWRPSYVPDDVVTPISALWVDQGRVDPDGPERVDDPALVAATRFATALERRGVTVVGAPRESETPAAATTLAAVESAPVEQLVQWMLEVSDNETAEVLFRHVARAEGRPASFAGGADAVAAVLARLRIDLTDALILDGSGLSRRNRLDPAQLVAVLERAASPEHPELRRLISGLPVAGFTGSLLYRFETGAPVGPGRVRAKTGTLTGVHGLAGVTTDRDGVPLTFAVVADRVKVENTLAARGLIDEMAAALAACRCGADPEVGPRA